MIICLYTTITVGIFVLRNTQELDREWNGNSRRAVQQMREQMDIKLQLGFNLVYQLKSTTDFQNYSGDEIRNYHNITLVLRELKKNREAFESYGYRIDVMKPDDSLVITPFGTIDKAKYFQEMAFTEEDIQQITGYAQDSRYSNVLLLKQKLTESENYTFDTVSFVKKELSGKNDLMFVLSFFETGFYPELNKLDTPIYSIGILKDDRLVDSKHVEPGTVIPQEAVAAVQDHRAPYTEQYHDDEIYLVGSLVLEHVRYLFMVSGYAWQPQLSGLLIHSAVMFGVLIVLGAGVAFLASRNIYKPIQNVLTIFKGLDQGKHTPHDQASGRTDDMSFITETAMTISRTNDSLKEALRNNRLSLRHNFLRDTLYGIIGEEQVRINAEKYELEEFSNSVTVVIMELINVRELEDQFPIGTVAEIKAGTFKIIVEELKKELQYELVELEHKRYALIIKEQQTGQLKKIFTHVLSGIEADIGIRVVAAIGSPAGSLSQIAGSYRDAIHLLAHRFALDKHTVITVSDVIPPSPDKYYYPLDVERDLITFVFQGKSDQVEAIISRILDENLEERYISGEMLSHFIFAVDVTVHRILNQMNKDYAELFEHNSLYDELKKSGNRNRVRQRIHEVFTIIMASMNSRNEKQDHTVAQQMLDHIHHHFNEDVSLSQIAEQFNLSLSYISLLFKKHTGENFKEYLNQYRVNKAKELLKEDPSISINEVAGMVGCNSVNTFIRIFKKYEGVSPGQYAKRTE
jgi:AraC-like DNA-binding protein